MLPAQPPMRKMWLRSWTNDLYLWYSEVPDLDPAPYTILDYFDLLITPNQTPSGNPKDKFHFRRSRAMSGSHNRNPERQRATERSGSSYLLSRRAARWWHTLTRIRRQRPQEAATETLRGTEILTVDGMEHVNANDQASIDTLNAGLFPTVANQARNFTVRDVGSQTIRSITMTSAIVDVDSRAGMSRSSRPRAGPSATCCSTTTLRRRKTC